MLKKILPYSPNTPRGIKLNLSRQIFDLNQKYFKSWIIFVDRIEWTISRYSPFNQIMRKKSGKISLCKWWLRVYSKSSTFLKYKYIFYWYWSTVTLNFCTLEKIRSTIFLRQPSQCDPENLLAKNKSSDFENSNCLNIGLVLRSAVWLRRMV